MVPDIGSYVPFSYYGGYPWGFLSHEYDQPKTYPTPCKAKQCQYGDFPSGDYARDFQRLSPKSAPAIWCGTLFASRSGPQATTPSPFRFVEVRNLRAFLNRYFLALAVSALILSGHSPVCAQYAPPVPPDFYVGPVRLPHLTRALRKKWPHILTAGRLSQSRDGCGLYRLCGISDPMARGKRVRRLRVLLPEEIANQEHYGIFRLQAGRSARGDHDNLVGGEPMGTLSRGSGPRALPPDECGG